MDEVILNKNEVIYKKYGNIDFLNLEPISVKNCDLREYLDFGGGSSTAHFAIKSFFIANLSHFTKDKKIIVDVKFHDLGKNKYPCIPGWHTDGSLLFSKIRPEPEKYLLYVTGDICMTEFCHDEFIVPREKASFELIKNHEAKSISALSSGHYALYDSTNMHRGTKSKTSGKRLLLRMMTSDKIRGEPYNESLFTPYNM